MSVEEKVVKRSEALYSEVLFTLSEIFKNIDLTCHFSVFIWYFSYYFLDMCGVFLHTYDNNFSFIYSFNFFTSIPP